MLNGALHRIADSNKSTATAPAHPFLLPDDRDGIKGVTTIRHRNDLANRKTPSCLPNIGASME